MLFVIFWLITSASSSNRKMSTLYSWSSGLYDLMKQVVVYHNRWLYLNLNSALFINSLNSNHFSVILFWCLCETAHIRSEHEIDFFLKNTTEPVYHLHKFYFHFFVHKNWFSCLAVSTVKHLNIPRKIVIFQ